jgi:hypothetical protein
MRRIFSLATVVALGLSVVALGFGPGVSAAQSAGNNSTDQPASAGSTTEMAQSLDQDVNLSEWSYADGVWTLRFRHSGRAPKVLTITEATQPGEGATRFSVRRERITTGVNTITMRTRVEAGESAIGITSPASLRAGYGIVLSTGKVGRDPFAPYGGASGVLSGVGISIGLSGLAAMWVIWREETGVVEA